jgi:GAF domain-containing protein/PAS domain-containing protein
LRVTIDLEPSPDSAGAGRRFLQETLAGWDCPADVIKQAIQVGAELLTNAILHAGTPFTVEVSYAEGVARVSVRDYSPAMAAVRRHRLDATTGRGLDLVGALSRRWGVAALPDGKVVWAEVDGQPHDEGVQTGQDQIFDAVQPIRFAALPVADYLTMAAHDDAVLREVELAWLDETGGGGVTTGQPPELLRLARGLGGLGNLLRREVETAAAEGKARADIVLALSRGQLLALRDWSVAIEHAQELSRSGELLAVPASEEVVVLRRSLIGELERRLAESDHAEPGPGAVEAGRGFRLTIEDAPIGHLQLGLALEATGMAAWDLDLSTLKLRWTGALGELLGLWPRLGDRASDVLDVVYGSDRADLRAAVDAALQSGEPQELDFRVLAADSSVRWMHAKIRSRRDTEGKATHVVGVLLDVTERRRIEQSLRRERTAAQAIARRLARLQAATARLAEVRGLNDVAKTVIEVVIQSLAADRAGVWLLGRDQKTIRLVQQHNYSPEVSARWRRVSLDDDLPATQALRTGRAFETELTTDGGQPGLTYTLPLEIEGRPIGILSLTWTGDPGLDDEERRFIAALADQCAQALDRARLYEAERRAVRRQQFVAEASRELAASLDLNATVERVARLLVPELADGCSVMVVEDKGLKAVAHAHVDPAKEDLMREISARPETTAISYLAEAVRTGKAVAGPTVEPGLGEETALDDEHREQIRALDIRSGMVVPMQARGTTVGLLGLHMTDSGRQFRPGDVETVIDLADRAAVAIDNARTYELRNQVAETLQRSLLPGRLPRIEGAQLSARYDPAQTGVDVGGDFYDVFDAEGDWVLALGDVRGKGASAAALTAMVRYSLRALAGGEQHPSAILARLNDAILRQHQDDEEFCTVVLAGLTRTASGFRTTVCSAGHPLPLIVRADGTLTKLGAPGGLLGLFPEIPLTEDATDLAPGDALVLYTDGVTEAHRGRQLFGEKRLSAALASRAGSDAETMADAVQRAVQDFTEGPRRDDVAVLVLTVEGSSP